MITNFTEYAAKQDACRQIYLEMASEGADHEEIQMFFEENGVYLDEGFYNMMKGLASGGANLVGNVATGIGRTIGGIGQTGAAGLRGVYGLADKAVTGDGSHLAGAGRWAKSGLSNIGSGITQIGTSPIAAAIRTGDVGREKGWLPEKPKAGGSWWQKLMGLRSGGSPEAAPEEAPPVSQQKPKPPMQQQPPPLPKKKSVRLEDATPDQLVKLYAKYQKLGNKEAMQKIKDEYRRRKGQDSSMVS